MREVQIADGAELLDYGFSVRFPIAVYDNNFVAYDNCVIESQPGADTTPAPTALYDKPESIYDDSSYDVPEGDFIIVVARYDEVDVVYDWCVYDELSPLPPIVDYPVPMDGRFLIFDGNSWESADFAMPVYQPAKILGEAGEEDVIRPTYIPSVYVWIPRTIVSSTESTASYPRSYTGYGVPRSSVPPEPEEAVFDGSVYDRSLYAFPPGTGTDAVYDMSGYDESFYAEEQPYFGSKKVALYDDKTSTYDVSFYGEIGPMEGVEKPAVYDDEASQFDISLYGEALSGPIPGEVKLALYDDPASTWDVSLYASSGIVAGAPKVALYDDAASQYDISWYGF